jgi:hypothetical protein
VAYSVDRRIAFGNARPVDILHTWGSTFFSIATIDDEIAMLCSVLTSINSETDVSPSIKSVQ